MASELKELFDDKFALYKTQLGKMNEIAPSTISKLLDNTVQGFFKTLETQIRQIEQNVLGNLNSSKNLHALTNLITTQKPTFGAQPPHSTLYLNKKNELDSLV